MPSAKGPIRKQLGSLAGIEDLKLNLAKAALLAAGLHRPEAKIEHYLGHLDELTADLAELGHYSAAADRAMALAEVMMRRHRYRGEDGDDAIAEASLMWVIDNRCGVGEALGILGMEVAGRLGWKIEALAFAPRFLVRVQGEDGERVIVDPALGWTEVDPPSMRALNKAARGMAAELSPADCTPLGNRAVLIRLQNEAKMRFLRAGSPPEALAVVEATLLFAPDQADFWREAGMMHLRSNQLARAVASFEQFAARTDDPEARKKAVRLLDELKNRMH